MRKGKMMVLKRLFLSLFVLVACLPARAENEFQKWLQEEQASFMTYKDERDRAFIGFLKEQWTEFQMS